MSLPPGPSIPPGEGSPGGGYSGLGKARKANLEVIALICQGAYPLEPETGVSTAINTCVFQPAPTGKRRVVVRGWGYDDTSGSMPVWVLHKANGTICWLDGVISSPAVGVGITSMPAAIVRPVILKEGEWLTLDDPEAIGGTILASYGYVDIEVE
jgi:hypothetical protein